MLFCLILTEILVVLYVNLTVRRNKQYESNQKENERVRTSSKDGQPVVTSQHQNELEAKSVGISNKEYNGLESKGQSSNKNSENHKNLVTNESFVCESNLVLTSLCGLNAVLFDSN
jgi:hypothetical protein